MQSHTIADLDIVIFSLGTEEYGIPISHVREIIERGSIMYVPRAVAYIKGLINLRGSIIPVIDLAMRIDSRSSNNADNQLIIVVDVQNKLNGLIVDSVSEVVQISKDNVGDLPLSTTNVNAHLFFGIAHIANRLILLLDMKRLFSDVLADT